MDLSKDRICVDNDKLNVFNFSTILLKKISMNKILDESETNSYNTSLSFTNIDEYYMDKKNSFIDKQHNISIVVYVNVKSKYGKTEKTTYLNYVHLFHDNELCCEKLYVNKFKNYFNMDQTPFYTNFIMESKFYLTQNDNMTYNVVDPYFKQKISSIGKSILFYKNYRTSFIPFMVLFNNYMNTTKHNTNLNTMSKLTSLFDKLDNEDVISLPNETVVIEFINKVLKYKKILNKISKGSYYNVNCSTSIFKIKITHNNGIVLYINGINVLNETELGRFKYMPHIGLMFFIKCIIDMGKFDSLFIKLQKHIIKTT